jgi:hypothetical protein
MANVSGTPAPDAAHDKSLGHAWDWFSHHSTQRMQGINFLLVSVALALAGYGAAFDSGNFVGAAVVALAGAVIAGCFAALDVRNRQLVQVGEAALRILESRLATQEGVPELELVERAHGDGRIVSYRVVVRVLAIVAIATFIVAGVVAVASATASIGHGELGV